MRQPTDIEGYGGMRLPVRDHRCRTCGAVYPLALYTSARAPHGPNKDCQAPDGWEMLPEDHDAGA